MTDRKLIIANLLQRAMNALLYAHIPSLDDYQELKYVIIEYDEVLRETLAQTERIAQLEHDLKAERERVEKAEADAKHYHQKCEMLLTAMYEAEEKAELAAILERKEK